MPQTYRETLQDGMSFSDRCYSKRVPALATAQREFDERKNPQHWFTKSLNLSQSARLLWDAGERNEDPALLAVGLMLDAMSLELVTKGMLIGRSRSDPASTDPISDADLQKVVDFSHRLTKLVPELGLALLPTDERALSALEDYLTWAGRYPLPKNVAAYRASEAEHGMPPGDVWEQVRSIRQRLAAMFDPTDADDRFASLPNVFRGS